MIIRYTKESPSNKLLKFKYLCVKRKDVQKLIFQDAHGVIMCLLPKILGI